MSILPSVSHHITYDTNFRKHAKVSGEGVPQASSISNDEIEAAKREWADLVLSDDE